MKCSEWLRQYQITGKVPDEERSELCFWCGWLIGSGGNRRIVSSDVSAQRQAELTMAIRAAEFIEAQK